jgi:nucleoside phosphorylase
MAASTLFREDYTVGIICALHVERAAVCATLDENHELVQKTTGDENAYAFGRIGEHNVVIAVMGKESAATVARDLMYSFPIRFSLMVGVGGGVWSERIEIRLGDVVVSERNTMYGGVVQWDYGKMERDGVFRATGYLSTAPLPLLDAMMALKARKMHKISEMMTEKIDATLMKHPKLYGKLRYLGAAHDKLFEAAYWHTGGDTCDSCNMIHLMHSRPHRTNHDPRVHHGVIASSDCAVEDGLTRDRIAREADILCFETEAAGLPDTFPCVVIRGVCSYADSHKNEQWQWNAAAAAAAYANILLLSIRRQKWRQYSWQAKREVCSIESHPGPLTPGWRPYSTADRMHSSLKESPIRRSARRARDP